MSGADAVTAGAVWDQVVSRLGHIDLGLLDSSSLNATLIGSVVVGIILCASSQAWGVFRIVVTVVHELGHALIGLLTGRRLHGITVRRDMSGETVTSGRTRGPAMVVTSWFGYPVPGLVGIALVGSASTGWAAPVIAILLLIMVFVLVMARSWFTVFIFLVTTAALAALWWTAEPTLSTAVLIAFGVLLQLGGGRAVLSLIRDHRQGRTGHSDAAALARITIVPPAVWLGSFGLVYALVLCGTGAVLAGFIPEL
ncbi:M50 family metallopeptidase [Saxibacter everestensis]|uniref:M50 family metallopeptidase n=1 Tax=Saxibacter everestensis TaxID=2909229 RepID=A0ABY8QWC6_9MICO|nr:M50 family metallopeptidase [Brevibacteriaceae bacterium ZFBP1038]